jgi:hypothetical protein
VVRRGRIVAGIHPRTDTADEVADIGESEIEQVRRS